MLEELFNLVRSSAKETVINNPDVPNEHNNEVVAEATNTVASGLRNIVAGGGLQNLVSLFGNNNRHSGGNLLSNPIVNMMVGHFTEKLMTKYKMGGGQASNVANNLIPNVLGELINKTNDPNNSGFSLENLLNSITGGKTTEVLQQQPQSGSGFSLPELISQFGGSQSSAGGLMDIVSKMAQGAQEQQQRNGGGGLMDLIKGFIK
jgi:hypothetical protein